MIAHKGKEALWSRFCEAHRIAERAVPLFNTTGEVVKLAPWGGDGRPTLARSPAMEAMLIGLAERLVALGNAPDATAQGILYMMLWRDGELVTPLYVGRAGRIGKRGGLSANLLNLTTDRSKFARWGSNYAYHVGDLSAVVCEGHLPAKRTPKYVRWAERLFEANQSAAPRLKREVMFWATVWGNASPSIWHDYSPSSLAFQEYLLIGVASDLFADSLLNTEGVN